MKAGEVICPHCDHVLDTSFFSSDPDAVESKSSAPAKTPIEVPRARARASAAPIATPAEHAKSDAAPAPVSSGDKSLEVLTTLWRDSIAIFTEAKLLDRGVFAGFCVVVTASILPWKETAAMGGALGLGTWGALTVVFSFGAAFAIAVRLRGLWPSFPRSSVGTLQIVCALLAAVWSGLFIRGAWDERMVPGFQIGTLVPVSQPGFGAFLALLGALAQVAFTGLWMLQQNSESSSRFRSR